MRAHGPSDAKSSQLRISIVTPCFNHAEFLDATIESVLRQDYSNLEYIVIDGGSTDGSAEIIEKYHDDLSYAISETDGGQTDALIKGFSRATGDILAWLNSDDLLEENTLHEVAEFFAHHPDARFAYGDARWISRDGRPIRDIKEIPFSRFVTLYAGNYIPQPSAFWRRDLYDQAGGLDSSFDLAMDADLWLRFADLTSPQHVRRIWSCMRTYPEQKNRRLRTQSNIEGMRIERRYITTTGAVCHAKRFVARGLRVAWKATTRCYW